MNLKEWDVLVGVVTAPFGIRGEVKVRSTTNDPERFLELKKVRLNPELGADRLVSLDACRIHHGAALVRISGVQSRNDADLIRGAKLYARRSDAPPLQADEYLVDDLIGMEVVTDAGKALGKVGDVLPYPAQPLMKVGEHLIPLAKAFVVDVDAMNRKITVSLLPGMLGEETDAESDAD